MRGIILTGISKGLGKAFFDYLITTDSFLLCISRRFLEYQIEIAQKNSNVNLLKIDLSSSNVIDINKELFEVIPLNRIAEIIFINNAGIIDPIDKVGNLNNQIIYNSMSINFFAPILLINLFIKICTENNIHLKILNISTGAATKPYCGWSMYCSTKGGFKFFLDVLKMENEGNDGIQVFNIDPGVMDTDMQKSIRDSNPEKFPLHSIFVDLKRDGRLAIPETVAKEIIENYLDK